jgi:hypothetical protein
MLEEYCEDDVKVLRQACQVFHGDFTENGNTDIY